MTKDWRLQHLETLSYLRGVAIIRKTYQSPSPEWDHDYCTACWATLAKPGIKAANTLHEGYTTTANFEHGADFNWICVPCFDRFGDIMQWRDVTETVSD